VRLNYGYLSKSTLNKAVASEIILEIIFLDVLREGHSDRADLRSRDQGNTSDPEE
jgi:hypothetical protein